MTMYLLQRKGTGNGQASMPGRFLLQDRRGYTAYASLAGLFTQEEAGRYCAPWPAGADWMEPVEAVREIESELSHHREQVRLLVKAKKRAGRGRLPRES